MEGYAVVMSRVFDEHLVRKTGSISDKIRRGCRLSQQLQRAEEDQSRRARPAATQRPSHPTKKKWTAFEGIAEQAEDLNQALPRLFAIPAHALIGAEAARGVALAKNMVERQQAGLRRATFFATSAEVGEKLLAGFSRPLFDGFAQGEWS